MMKDAYYFSHDSNARNDEKVLALRIKHDWKGYGIFWAIIEKMRESTNYMCIKDYNLIAFDLRVDSGIIKSIVEDFGLFVVTECGKYFYSERLRSSMEIKEQKSLKAKISASKRWDKSDNNANAMRTHSDGNAIKEKESKEKESKEKESKENGFFLIQEISKQFYSVNQFYAKDETKDFHALKNFAEFISNKKFSRADFSNLDQDRQLEIVKEFELVSHWYQRSKCTKSLETLAKFSIQQIFTESNGKHSEINRQGRNIFDKA